MEQNFNLYHIFYTVAKCKNISGAARELYISQPAISKAVSRLEQNLNTTLFVRSSRGVRLTETGEMLFRQVENAFLSLSQGEEQIKKVQELGIGRLSIGASATVCKYILLPYLSRFTTENPHIQISISCQSTSKTMEALEQNTVDIGLIGENDIMDRMHFEPVHDIEDIFVTTESYLNNLYERTGLDSHSSVHAVLSQAALMLLDKENITRQYIDKYLTRETITCAQLIETTSMDLLIDFARIGLGIACVIRSFVREDLESGRLVHLKMPVSIPERRVGYAWPKNAAISPSMHKFIDFFRCSGISK